MLLLQQRIAVIGNDTASRDRLEASITKLSIKLKEHVNVIAATADKSKVWQQAVAQNGYTNSSVLSAIMCLIH
jgi:hypothetical protein